MTYGELDRRSGEIARYLRRLGVAADARVALVVERSPEMVAALLGILKAGGGYLPLDPSYPRERLALLLADAAPAAVVGPRHLLAALPGTAAPRLALEDALARGGAPHPSWRRRASREPRLRALHLGLDRHAQGGRGQPSRGGAAGARYGLRGVRPRRGLPPTVADVVRPGDLRDLGAAPQRRPSGAPAARAVHGGRRLRGGGAPRGDDALADLRPLPPRGGGGARAARRPAPAAGRRRRPVAPARACGRSRPCRVSTSSTATARPRTRPSRPPTACATASRRASRRCRSGGRSPPAAPTCSTARSRRCRPGASGSSTWAAPAWRAATSAARR